MQQTKEQSQLRFAIDLLIFPPKLILTEVMFSASIIHVLKLYSLTKMNVLGTKHMPLVLWNSVCE